MRKKPDYALMYTLRKDGRFMGFWHELDRDGKPTGKRHAICDRDPERLFERIREKESGAVAPLTFEDASEAWEKKHLERVGWKTAETYVAPLRRIRERFAGAVAEEITAQEIQSFINDLGKQSFSRRSVQLHRDIISMIFNDAILSGAIRFNPCSAVTMPRNLPSSRRELPADEAVAAVRASDAPFSLFAKICLYSGLRRGEVLALRYEDIDRANGTIYVSRAVEYIGNEPHIKPPKSRAGVRTVPLLAPLAAALPPSGAGLIFPGKSLDIPLTKTQFRKRWLRFCEDIGFDITAHQLRHGFATILYEAGIADKDAQELLGHSSITVTRNVYTHIRSAHRQETARRLNDYVVRSVVSNQKNR